MPEIVLFNIIYYMECRGRENLRLMTKQTFKLSWDHNGRRYIYQAIKESDKNHQAIKESDKNHTEIDMQASNEVKIFKVKSLQILFLVTQNRSKT